MSYEKLFELKYRHRIPTGELIRRFPNQRRRVTEVALIEIPEPTLREVIPEKRTFERLMGLKKKFLKEMLSRS